MRVIAVGCGSLSIAAAILTVTTWTSAAAIRREYEARFRHDIGPLELPSSLPAGPETENAAYWVRAAAESAGTLQDTQAEAKRLEGTAPTSWNTVDRVWIRDQWTKRAVAWEQLERSSEHEHSDFGLDLVATSQLGKVPDDLLVLVRLGRLGRLAAAEGLNRDDFGPARRVARGLLGAGRALDGAPLALYRLIGSSLERSGLQVVQSSLDRISRPEASHLLALESSFANIPDAVALRRGDALAFYFGGIETVGLPFIPHDWVRALFLRCEIAFATLPRGNLEEARTTVARINAAGDIRDKMCRPFADARLEGAVLDALMQRARELAVSALAVRAGEDPSRARVVLAGRRVLQLPATVRWDTTPDAEGWLKFDDPTLASLAAEFTKARALAQLRTLSSWRSRPAPPHNP